VILFGIIVLLFGYSSERLIQNGLPLKKGPKDLETGVEVEFFLLS